MDLKKLEYLESVYRLQSFSKAAEEHFISQPSISNAIKKLEEELGVILIDRNAKPLTLTMDGLRFLSHVYRILGDVQSAQSEMRSIAAEHKRQLNVLVHSTIGDWVVSQMAFDFHREHPQIKAVMHEALGSQMLYMLEHENMDLAYTLFPPDLNIDLFETIPIIDCTMYVLLPPGHSLLEKQTLSVKDLSKETVITFPRGALICSTVEEMFQKQGFSPKIVTPGPINVITQLVQQGYGVGFVTLDQLTVIGAIGQYHIRPLKDPVVFTKGFIMKRGRRSPKSMLTLISYVKEAVSKKLNIARGLQS